MKIILLIMVVMLVVVGVAAGLSLVPDSPVYQWWDSEPAPRPTYTGVTPEPEDLPDLAIYFLGYSDHSPHINEPFTVTIYTQNQGTAPSPQCIVSWWPYTLGQAVVYTIPPLETEERHQTSFTATVDRTGEFESSAWIECQEDSNEENNTYTTTIWVRQ